MLNKESLVKHLQYPEFDQDSIFELGKVNDALVPAMGEMSDNLYAPILEEPELNYLFCNQLEIDQIRSFGVTLCPC